MIAVSRGSRAETAGFVARYFGRAPVDVYVDGSGSVSRTEATNMIIADAFAMYDADGDGFVTKEQFLALRMGPAGGGGGK